MRIPWFRFLLLGLIVVFLITACSDRLPPAQILTDASSSEDCRVVQHELGETKLCGQPQRVAALSPHILDSMLSLGVQPIAYAEASTLNLRKFDRPAEQIPYLGKYMTTQPINLGNRDNPSLELLTQLKPDVILGEYWISKGQYRLLSQIAPTLLFSDIGENDYQHWKHDIEEIASALGREDQAKQLLNRYPDQIAAVRNQLAPVVAAYPHVLVVHANNLAQVHWANDSKAADLLQMLGFSIVSSEDLPFKSGEEGQISIEILPQIESNLIFVLGWSEELYEPQQEIKQQWSKNPLLQKIPAFQNGRVFFVDYQLWGSVTRGPMTDELILDELPQLLLPLVGKQQ
jgi:iron complex transport system substrate-binding protein